MDNMDWNKLFCAFFDAEEQGIEIPFTLRTAIGQMDRRDTSWEKLGTEWKNCRDYESITIQLTERNTPAVRSILEALAVPAVEREQTVTLVARPVEGLQD